MDFDPRDDDSRDDDRLAFGQSRGRGASYDDLDRDDDLRLPATRNRDDYTRDLGRGPGGSRQSNAAGQDPRDEGRGPGRERDPHNAFTRDLNLPLDREREMVRDRDREYSLRGSESRTLATVGAFRVVSSRDLQDDRDRPLDSRTSDLRHLREQGLVEVTRLPGSREYAVSLTKDGRSLLESHRDRDQEGRQTFYAGVKRERELEHDVQVYRAFEREAERLEERGARIDRVVLDYELKREYQQWLHARDRDRDDYDGHPDRDPREIEEWARQHDLPYFDQQVHFPDARIEYEDADGRWDHVDVEVVTVHYRGAHGSTVARSGFSCYRGSSARVGGQPSRWSRRRVLAMNFEDRVKAVAEFGFTERQSGFLVTVMLHSGVCVPRQYASFAGVAYGQKVSRFFDKLIERGYATACGCLHNRAELYHVKHHALYRAIGEPNSRYRRPVAARQAIDRLIRLDAILLRPDLVWLATEGERVSFFSLMAPSLTRERLPHLTVGNGVTQRTRLFADDQPVGVTTTGRVIFMYLVNAFDSEPLRAFVQRHYDLFHALPGWTLRLVFPQSLADAAARLEGIARDELRPLRPEVIAELKWYFAQRRSTLDPRRLAFDNPEFWQDQAAFSSPRFQQLYRRWLMDGDSVFEAISSTVIADALDRGTGRIESHLLPFSYPHLAPLVSLFRSCRKGVEGGETSSARSQPPRGESISTAGDAGVQ